jgi:hypothetical protein
LADRRTVEEPPGELPIALFAPGEKGLKIGLQRHNIVRKMPRPPWRLNLREDVADALQHSRANPVETTPKYRLRTASGTLGMPDWECC